MPRSLVPAPHVPLRIGLFVVLEMLLVISPGEIPAKILGFVLIAFLTGSYRRAVLHPDHFELQMVIGWVPLKRRRWKLERFAEIEIGTEDPAGWGTFFLFGPVQWLWSRVMDFVLPWFGGVCILWLRTTKGKRILVWQGNSDENFQENLAMLREVTGLEYRRSVDR